MTMTLSGSGTIAGLVAGGLPDATVTSSDLASNAVDSQTLSLFNATGSAPVYACRAWVNFNGTGTVAIRASGNVSSITDGGNGIYTVNFTTAMPDANFSTVATANYYCVSYYETSPGVNSPTTTSAKLYVGAGPWTGTYTDSAYVMAAFFR